MKRKKSQNAQIEEYLMTGEKISPLIALNKFGCMRLASRIKELIEKGLNIQSKMVHDHPVHFKQYWIEK